MVKPWMETVAGEWPYVFHQNHPGLAESQPEGPLSQGNLASQLTRL